MTTELPSEAIVIELGKVAYFIKKNEGAINLPKNEERILDILEDINGVFEKIKNLVKVET